MMPNGSRWIPHHAACGRGRATEHTAASTSQMGRFETEVLTQPGNLAELTKLSGKWIDRLRERQPMRELILDMDSSVSETYGEQEGTAYNEHFGCTCCTCFCFNQFGDVEQSCCATATCIAPRIGGWCWNRWWHAIRVGTCGVIFGPMPLLPTRNSRTNFGSGTSIVNVQDSRTCTTLCPAPNSPWPRLN